MGHWVAQGCSSIVICVCVCGKQTTFDGGGHLDIPRGRVAWKNNNIPHGHHVGSTWVPHGRIREGTFKINRTLKDHNL